MFYCILEEYTSEIIVNKSRFIAYINRVSNREEIDLYLKKLQKEQFKATHICYAYKLSDQIVKFSDDGEPNGTAGLPLLNLLTHHQLENTILVVVRYFGGVKLGTGGLLRAYTDAGLNAINGAKKSIVKSTIQYTISFPYNLLQPISKILTSNGFVITKKEFLEDITIEFYGEQQGIIKSLNDSCLGKINLINTESIIIELPL